LPARSRVLPRLALLTPACRELPASDAFRAFRERFAASAGPTTWDADRGILQARVTVEDDASLALETDFKRRVNVTHPPQDRRLLNCYFCVDGEEYRQRILGKRAF
jgi:hypothetical protein